jgi:hypothetical protein
MSTRRSAACLYTLAILCNRAASEHVLGLAIHSYDGYARRRNASVDNGLWVCVGQHVGARDSKGSTIMLNHHDVAYGTSSPI